MKHHFTRTWTAALLAGCGLTSCSSPLSIKTVNLDTAHAHLTDGYVNSASLAFGHVFVWNTETNEARRIYRISPDQVEATVDEGPAYGRKSSSVSKDNEFEVGAGVPLAVKAEVTASVVKSTDVTLTNYNPQEYRDPLYVLNSPELRDWRVGLEAGASDSNAENFTDPKYRFVFISRVTLGDEVQIGREASGGAGAEADVIEVGEMRFKATYDNKSSVTIEADQAPLTIDPSVYKFRIAGDSYRFYRDETPFPLQEVKFRL